MAKDNFSPIFEKPATEAKETTLWTLRPATATAPAAATLHHVLRNIESQNGVSQKKIMTSRKPV